MLFLLPFAILVMWSSLPFVGDAFARGEISPDPGGVGYRWLIKAVIPLGFALLALQALADSLRAVLALREQD